MGIWKRAGRHIPENTIGVTPSQIVSVSPEPPRTPAGKERRRAPAAKDVSLWGGKVMLANEFAPEAGAGPRRHPWRVVGLLLVGGSLVAAAGWGWRLWDSRMSVPGRSAATAVAPPPPAAAVPAATTPPPAAPSATAPAAVPSAAPAAAAAATVPAAAAAPTDPPVAKKAALAKGVTSRSHRRHASSKRSKHSHKTAHRSAAE